MSERNIVLKESLNILSHGTTGLCTWQVKINEYIMITTTNRNNICTLYSTIYKTTVKGFHADVPSDRCSMQRMSVYQTQCLVSGHSVVVAQQTV